MNSKETQASHNFTLDSFQKSFNAMIQTNNNSYDVDYFGMDRIIPLKEYTEEDIQRIILKGNPEEQQILSNSFFASKGIYKQLIMHYATLLRYDGLLIPNPSVGKSLQDKAISKKFLNALDFVDRMKLKQLCQRIGYKALVNGAYYGVIQTMRKDAFVLLDLPFNYCRTRFKNEYEESIVEFDVRYFDAILDENNRKAALTTYPKVISSYYNKYHNNKVKGYWVKLPTDIGISFSFFDKKPFFLSAIPNILLYDQALDNEQKREVEEIKKILINKIPHLNDGTLLFEPNEAQVMHEGIVNMLKASNPNLSVMTTYGDVELEGTRTSDALANNTLKNVLNNIYASAGISSEIFAASGSSSLSTSLGYDVNVMMVLANKIANFVTTIVNELYSNGSVTFKFTFLSTTEFNKDDFIDESLKMASSGYSFTIPALAQGLSQKDLINIKNLENDYFKMGDLLQPLKTSYTQSGDGDGESGRPTLKDTEQTEKTVRLKESEGNTD